MEKQMENEMETRGIRRPWGACWMVAEGGEGENPLPFSLTAPKRGGGGGGGGGGVGGSGACWPGPQGLGARQRLKCWSEDGNRLSCLGF